ncbi:MAG: polysaccharide deacetylase family protein [Christensenellales bacterium]
MNTDESGLDQISSAEADNEIKSAVIAFTFDDGYLSDYKLAYPILKKYGIRGTSYIIPKYQDNNVEYTMTWDQIREMKQYGWDFGCHTYAHSNLTKMTKEQIQTSMEKVDESFLKQGLAAPIIHAFPYGKYDQAAIDAMKPYRLQIRKAFYETKFVDINNTNPYEIDCCSADMRTEKRLRQHKELVDIACKKHAVIVFRCHCLYRSEVNDMGDWPVKTDSRLFEKLVAYCVGKGCRFVTMTQLMGLYQNKQP